MMMQEHASKIVIVALLVAVVGVPFLLRPAAEEAGAVVAGPAETLVVITPHNEQIRYEFERAFNDWRRGRGEPAVRFDWRTLGGASDLRKLVLTQFEAAAARGVEEQGIGMDLFFGGGDFEQNKLAQGIKVMRAGEVVRIPATVPIELPPGLLEAAFPEPTIGGARLYHEDLYWVGAALSSFGIIYNRDVAMEVLDAPHEPVTWADLTDPRYLSWVALADPGHSGSIGAVYNVIVRRLGWTEGWSVLRRTFANSRYFTSGASKVPVDVSAGEAAVGMCIDFYGRYQAGAIGGDRIAYVDPAFMTATGADPVSILRGAPHPELANQFVVWLLSPEAQRLWQRELGTPDGPARFELRRQPVRRDLYTPEEKAYWTDPEVDPFATARPLPEPMPDFYMMIAPVAHAIGIDVHDELVAAWSAILRTPDNHPDKPRMLELFEAMPPELTLTWPAHLAESWAEAIESESHPQHAEAAQVLEAFADRLGSLLGPGLEERRLAWTLFFRDNYDQIVELAAD